MLRLKAKACFLVNKLYVFLLYFLKVNSTSVCSADSSDLLQQLKALLYKTISSSFCLHTVILSLILLYPILHLKSLFEFILCLFSALSCTFGIFFAVLHCLKIILCLLGLFHVCLQTLCLCVASVHLIVYLCICFFMIGSLL